ncbi:unnamed protein product [Protopolystoma xenopodis]|uniref:Uncharacterized protein n=1 Tax=Protopolystoma xenopodis TaxID=117903 RepID=A0A3S5CHB7_9PLAT|nr:unnamed protein product [Protopolystoma xenopodis]
MSFDFHLLLCHGLLMGLQWRLAAFFRLQVRPLPWSCI